MAHAETHAPVAPTAATAPRGINHVVLNVRNLEVSHRFWTEIMGFVIATDRPVGERRWIELTTPGAQTGILLFTPERHEERIGTFFNGSFGCDNVLYEYDRLSARGGNLPGAAADQAVSARLFQ